MRTALVITRAWPDHPEQAVHGIFQRLGLFLDALCARFDRVHMLAFPPASPGLESFRAAFERELKRRAGDAIELEIVVRRPNPNHWGFIDRYLLGALSVDRQENYRNIAGAAHSKAVMNALRREPDLVFAHRLHAFTPLLPAIGHAAVPIVFDMDDIEHRALAGSVLTMPRWPSERLRLLHVPSLAIRARKAVRRSAATFVCSQADAHKIALLACTKTVHCIPNSVPDPGPSRRPTVLQAEAVGFIGSMAHPPNLDAVRWILGEIWPLVRHRLPNARLRIAGAGAAAEFGAAHGRQGVEILDFVDDLAAFYDSLQVVLAPLRFGAGTRVKIIEAAAFSLPVVATPVGAEGLEFGTGQAIMIGSSGPGLADACVRLLQSPDMAGQLGHAARIAYLEHYERHRIVERIAGHFDDAMNPRQSRGS